MTRTVEFSIQYGDITSFDSDVVALKYAQGFYGAASEVAKALSKKGAPLKTLHLSVGDYRYVGTDGCIAARHALFVGVPPIWEFSYPQIREFSTKVVSTLADKDPNIKHLAMTIHGGGYGRDEIESAFAQFNGVVDALKIGQSPQGLERVTILDINRKQVQRLQKAFEQTLDNAEYASRIQTKQWAYRLAVQPRILHGDEKYSKESISIEKAGEVSEEKPNVFVAMPYKKEHDNLFYYGIQQPSRKAGFLCERIDKEPFTGEIVDQVKTKIDQASLVIAGTDWWEPQCLP